MIDKNKIDKNLKTILTKFSLKKNIQNLNISNYLELNTNFKSNFRN